MNNQNEFHNFFTVAKAGNNKWWIYVLILFAAFMANIVGSIPLIIYLKKMGFSMFELSGNMAAVFSRIEDKNTLLMLIGLPFIASLVTFWLLFKSLHQRNIDSVVSAAKQFRWHQYWFAFIICSILLIASTLIGYFMSPESYILQFQPKQFLTLLVVAFVFLTIQTITEEVLFRGYLTQGVGLLTKSRFLALLLPALIFGAMHLSNPEVAEHGIAKMFPLYLIMGLSFGVMTLMNEGTELAMGYHAANNIMISLLVTSPEAVLQTNSIFRSTEVANVSDQYGFLIIAEIVIIGIFAWKYKWKNWGTKLFGSINAQ